MMSSSSSHTFVEKVKNRVEAVASTNLFIRSEKKNVLQL